MAEKRRLPVVPSDEAEGERLGSVGWATFGAVAIFVLWLPFAALAQYMLRRLSTAWLGPASTEEVAQALFHGAPASVQTRLRIASVLLPALASSLASFAGGFLIGRFGDKVSAREGALAGVFVTLTAFAITAFAFGLQLSMLAVSIVLIPASAGGAWYGRRVARRLP